MRMRPAGRPRKGGLHVSSIITTSSVYEQKTDPSPRLRLPEPGISAATFIYASLWARRFVLRHLSLPRLVRLQRHDESTDSADAPLRLNWSYGNYPFYIQPTLWNRWGPKAWAVWAYGGTLPGDDPDEYLAGGYRFADLGPRNRMGKGEDEMARDFARLRAKGMGGCPFG